MPNQYTTSPIAPRACEYCGEQFTPHRTNATRGFGRYCSMPCFGMAKRDRASRTCTICGIAFLVKPSAVQRGGGNYCSIKCASVGRTIPREPNRHCRICGAGFWIPPSSRSPGAYCSLDCKRIGMSKPPTEAGRSSSQYNHWRSAVLKRDDGKCRECGSPTRLHVHHIRPWMQSPQLRFDVDNGITLCLSCHWQAHRLLI